MTPTPSTGPTTYTTLKRDLALFQHEYQQAAGQRDRQAEQLRRLVARYESRIQVLEAELGQLRQVRA